MGWSRSSGWGRSGSGSAAEPLRQTQQGTLYKRDRDRLTEDPVLACPIADALKPLARLPELWLELALPCRSDRARPGGRPAARRSAGILDRQRGPPAADDRHWLDGAAILARAGSDLRRRDHARARPCRILRFALLLLLVGARANRSGSPWTTWPSQLSERWPAWDRLSFADRARGVARRGRGAADRRRAGLGSRGARGAAARARRAGVGPARRGLSARPGPRRRGRRGPDGVVVQLTPLGRYVLAVGPTPPPRPTFEQFLFVQPNFEVIAYRQGLTPQFVGRLSRFAWWSQIGAALELKLTRESIVLGLDGGLTPEAILETLDEAQPAGAARRRHRRRHQLGQPPRTGDLLRGRHADRVRLVRRARRGHWRSGPSSESRRADRGRRAVPAGRGRANRPVRPPPPDQLARLSPAAGDLRDWSSPTA